MGRPKTIIDSKLTELFQQQKSLKEIAEIMQVSSAAVCKRVRRLGLSRTPPSLAVLNERERGFVMGVASGKTRTAACMEAYGVVESSAKSMQRELMRRPAIKASLCDLMDSAGIGRPYRVFKLKEHLESNDPVVSLKSLDMANELSGDKAIAKQEAIFPVNEQGWMFTRFDVNLLATVHKFNRLDNQCSICKTEGTEPFCIECLSKYPVLTDKLLRHWNGDICASCEDELRCLKYCLACEKKKEKVNHAEKYVGLQDAVKY